LANLDGHDRRRFSEIASNVDIDSARNAEFESLDWRHKQRLIAALLRKSKRERVSK
jgi:hypothetical protein